MNFNAVYLRTVVPEVVSLLTLLLPSWRQHGLSCQSPEGLTVRPHFTSHPDIIRI